MKITIIKRRYKDNENKTIYFANNKEAERYLNANGFIQDLEDNEIWWYTEKVSIYAIIN